MIIVNLTVTEHAIVLRIFLAMLRCTSEYSNGSVVS